ncbi:MAG: hypothetical protein M3P06_11215 [Acidobacteriota bacterium]|nr:hypothetical protein [Acidobacteriota bacterium]
MEIRGVLKRVLNDVVGGLAVGASVDWPTVVKQLDETHREALRFVDSDPGQTVSVVSAANLLADCKLGLIIDLGALHKAIGQLDLGNGWNTAFTDLLRHGKAVKLAKKIPPLGCTAIHWQKFVDIYAGPLGYPSKPDHERLWNDIRNGARKLPLEDLDLANPSGSTSSWVTADDHDGDTLKTGDPNRDVYDALGLYWDLTEPTTRAVLICCGLDMRERAAQSLHCPSSVDGWNNLFFVSRPQHDDPWPHHGSATARPTSDAPSMPEAIHGPAQASPASVEIFALRDEVTVGDRVVEYGDAVMQRAIGRVRKAAGL